MSVEKAICLHHIMDSLYYLSKTKYTGIEGVVQQTLTAPSSFSAIYAIIQ
jgi:hypothetical protein